MRLKAAVCTTNIIGQQLSKCSYSCYISVSNPTLYKHISYEVLSFEMFGNYLITFFYIKYSTIIGGNHLSYDVSTTGFYNITYETLDTRYVCTGQADVFSTFDPHSMAYDPEKTMDELRLSGPNTDGVPALIPPGAVCSRYETVVRHLYNCFHNCNIYDKTSQREINGNEDKSTLMTKLSFRSVMSGSDTFYTIRLNADKVNREPTLKINLLFYRLVMFFGKHYLVCSTARWKKMSPILLLTR